MEKKKKNALNVKTILKLKSKQKTSIIKDNYDKL